MLEKFKNVSLKRFLTIVLSIILLALVIITFIALPPVGSFFSYSFAYLFGFLSPFILVLIFLFAILLLFINKIKNHKIKPINIVISILLFISITAISSYSLAADIDDISQFIQFYNTRMLAFSSQPFLVEDYSSISSLGGGIIGLLFLTMFSSFMTLAGSISVYSIILFVSLGLLLFSPIKSLILSFKKPKEKERESKPNSYSSPYQKQEDSKPRSINFKGDIAVDAKLEETTNEYKVDERKGNTILVDDKVSSAAYDFALKAKEDASLEESEDKEDIYLKEKRKKEEERILSLKKEKKTSTIENIFYTYKLPDSSFLSEVNDSSKIIINNEAAQEKARIINQVFEDFKIQGKAISFTVGASVTRFNIQMEPGVKSEKINSVLNELQIALKGDKSVRIETVVEGRTTSGIEVGNKTMMAVSFKECFEELQKYPEEHLLLPIGKDISGNIISYPLDKMPHLLVAGTTGSGKSVLIQTFIMTLIMRNYPDDLKLILIDPKQVEFERYSDEPHLFCPVVNESSQAITILRKLCEEMEHRYTILRQNSVVKVADYRKKRRGHEKDLPPMPDIVCVIDEFADLMQTGGNEVAEAVQRISQKARAAGIYLIIATQRPSKDVIPMVIKSNIACRIGLSCSTAVDSRVILDENGAETLLGKGDLLFKIPGKKSMIRAQSSFISDEDMMEVLDYLKKEAGGPIYNPDFLETEEELDIYNEIKDYVMDTGIASKSAIMRNFSISYQEAESVLNSLKEEGIIMSSANGKNVVVQRKEM